MTVPSEIFPSENAAITSFALAYCLLLVYILVVYLIGIRKLKKRARGRTSLSISVRKLKKQAKWNAVGMAAQFLALIFAVLVVTIMAMHYQSYSDRLSVSINNYYDLVNSKNAQIDLISNECADMLAHSDAQNADLNWTAEKLKRDVRWLEDNYTSCLERNGELENIMNQMPFLAAGRDFVYNHTYDIKNFNCVDFSQGSVQTWRDMGYEAFTRAVRMNCSLTYCPDGNNRHMIAFISIPVECSGGFHPIPPSDFPKYNLMG
jgi:hypothetical protein